MFNNENVNNKSCEKDYLSRSLIDNSKSRICYVDLREKYLKFFESKGHAIIDSASLIPENDPSVLFTTAGMHPLVPYLSGEKHPLGTRLTDFQKCIRTGDIEEVGEFCDCDIFFSIDKYKIKKINNTRILYIHNL